MRQVTIALKYARALFGAAQEEGKTDRLAKDISSLGALQEDDAAFHRFLISPEVLTEHKLEFIQTVFGPRLDPLSVRFLELLIHKGRIDALPDIVETFQRLVEEHRGLLRAQIFSAVQLSPEHQRRLKAGLDRLTGKDVVLDPRLDPSLLGGVVVHLGTYILDGSLRRRAKVLRESLRRVEVN